MENECKKGRLFYEHKAHRLYELFKINYYSHFVHGKQQKLPDPPAVIQYDTDSNESHQRINNTGINV